MWILGVKGALSRGQLGSLISDVFERRTLTGSERFSLSICLDAIKFRLLSVFTLLVKSNWWSIINAAF